MSDTPPERGDALTPREVQVRDALLEGLTNKEAAIKLGISPRTIELHRSRILTKCGAKNTVHLARIVFGAPA